MTAPTVASTVPELLSLPWEILTVIVAQLGPSQADFDDFDHDYRPNVKLCKLSQTCSTVRELCTPGLYQICNIKTGRGSLRCGLGRLRTLATRPDIAARVKRIIVDAAFHVDARDDDRILISAEDANLYNHILQENFDMTTVEPLRELRAGHATELQEFNAIGQSLAGVAFALVPNITSAAFSTRYKSLEWTMTDVFPLLETFSILHADTTWGADIGRTEGVLLAAPNLERLVGWSINGLGMYEYTSIKEVVLEYSRLSDEEMACLPLVFPNLERFTYTDGGSLVNDYDAASPFAVSRALLDLGATLKHVQLGAPYESFSRSLRNLSHADRYMASLAPMRVLESLRFQAPHIYSIEDDPWELFSTRELLDFLPRSIQRLCLEDVQSSELDDILSLARSAPQRFPNLTHVTFTGLCESIEERVWDTFEAYGVKCSFEATGVIGYGRGCA